jgi:hypothetical protein
MLLTAQQCFYSYTPCIHAGINAENCVWRLDRKANKGTVDRVRRKCTHLPTHTQPHTNRRTFMFSAAEMLEGVQKMGHGMWIEWISQTAKKELEDGIKSLEKEAFWRGSDELARRWEEVDVPLESETGEVGCLFT